MGVSDERGTPVINTLSCTLAPRARATPRLSSLAEPAERLGVGLMVHGVGFRVQCSAFKAQRARFMGAGESALPLAYLSKWRLPGGPRSSV